MAPVGYVLAGLLIGFGRILYIPRMDRWKVDAYIQEPVRLHAPPAMNAPRFVSFDVVRSSHEEAAFEIRLPRVTGVGLAHVGL